MEWSINSGFTWSVSGISTKICGIKKYLVFHMARHTFATTITLAKGVSIEVVSRMLGHKNVKQTQHYAKLVNTRIQDEMMAIKSLY